MIQSAVRTPPVETQASAAAPVLEAKAISKRFAKPVDLSARIARALGAEVRAPVVHALDRVDLVIGEGEVVGLVGESGCGKSTLGRIVAGIMAPSEGQVLFRGVDTQKAEGAAARRIALAVQMVFQDPYASLNPRMRIRDMISEAPLYHGLVARSERAEFVRETLRRVKLDPSYADRYPHQFSGGQRQRIGVARALAVAPSLLVCDEAVAALDVSIQAQMLNLFMQLREELGLTYLFISHDLGVVEHISDRIVVMYLGRVVEQGETEELLRRPNHPYTQALLQEIPRIETGKRQFHTVKGEIPSPLNPPSGCHFHPRCPFAMPVCRDVAPPLMEIAPAHFSACHLNAQAA